MGLKLKALEPERDYLDILTSELEKANFKNFNELKKGYGNAGLVGDDRVVFNLAGNKFRLIVRIVFEYKAIQVKWFGTHAEYDKIDVESIIFKRR